MSIPLIFTLKHSFHTLVLRTMAEEGVKFIKNVGPVRNIDVFPLNKIYGCYMYLFYYGCCTDAKRPSHFP